MRLLADENFNGRILRGLLRRVSSLDVVRVQDLPEIAGSRDQEVLAWAAAEDRLLLTHDTSTMVGFAYERAVAGEPLPGVFVVPADLPIGQAIDELKLLVRASRPGEWRGRVRFLPL